MAAGTRTDESRYVDMNGKPMPQHVPSVEPGVHLNIGCGFKLWDGFINIDFPGNWSGKKPDIEADIRAIPLPDNYADSAYAIHVLEHFQRWETEDVLKEWRRVLKPEGKLIIEVPCLDKIIGHFNKAIATKTQINMQKTMFALYGDPVYKDETMIHKWCFGVGELLELFKDVGFRDVKHSEPEWHMATRDIRITGIK